MLFLLLLATYRVGCDSLDSDLSKLLKRVAPSMQEHELNPALKNLKHFQVAQLNSTIMESGRAFHLLGLQPRYPNAWRLSFDAFGRQYSFDLQKNLDLISPSYEEIKLDYVGQSNTRYSHVPSPRENCFYKAHTSDGYAAISTCSGVRGTIQTPQGRVGIEPLYKQQPQQQSRASSLKLLSVPSSSSSSSFSFSPSSVFASSPHVVFRYDVDEQEIEHDVCTQEGHGHSHRKLLADMKIDSLASEKHINLLVVNDYARYLLWGDEVEYESLAAVNEIDAMYRRSFPSLHIHLTAQVTFYQGDPYSPATKGGRTLVDGDTGLLTLFNKWRVTSPDVPAHDNGQLFSGRKFADSMVGLADMESMCHGFTSGGVGAHKYVSIARNAQVTAHELGHNLGMRHDGDMNECPTTGFVMASQAGPASLFSSCSKAYLQLFMSRDHPACMGVGPSHEYLMEANETAKRTVARDVAVSAGQMACPIVSRWSSLEVILCISVLAAVALISIFSTVVEMKRLQSWDNWPPKLALKGSFKAARKTRDRSLSDSDIFAFR